MDKQSKGGGTGDGGGGQGVLCTSQIKDSKIRGRLFVRDIYEAITNHGLTMKSVKISTENTDFIQPEAFKILVESIKSYFGPATKNLNFGTEKFWSEFEKRISFISDETPLQQSQDANSPITLPAGCKIIQIAFWHESSGPSEEGTLYVNRNYWKQLNQINKIALLAHEFFFKQARQAGFKNSDFVRNQIGKLLSIEGLTPIFKQWAPSNDLRVSDILPHSMKGFKYCTGEASEDPSAKLQFYQYEGKDGLQHFVIPVLQSNTVSMSFFQSHHATFNPKKDSSLARATDLMILGTDFSQESCNETCVKINDYISSSKHKELDAKFNLFYTGRELFSRTSTLFEAVLKDDISKLVRPDLQTIWSKQNISASQIVQIEILNPGYDPNAPSVKTLKSRDELIKTVFNKLTANLEKIYSSAGLDDDEFGIHADQIDSLLITLSNEVEAIIKTGGSDVSSFPKWTQALEKFFKNIYEHNPQKKDFDHTELNVSTFFELPRILLKLKLNSYQETDFFKIVEGIDIYQNSQRKIKRGGIRVRQNNSALDFKLTCKSYTDLYVERTEQNYVTDSNGNGTNQADFNFELEFENVDQKQEKLLKTILSSYQSHIDDETSANFAKSDFRYIDIRGFAQDLGIEKKIIATPCEEFQKNLNYNRKFQNKFLNCTILQFQTAKNSYLFYFESDVSDTMTDKNNLKIKYLNKIPFGFERDPESNQNEHNNNEGTK